LLLRGAGSEVTVAAIRQLRAIGFANPIIALTARAMTTERDLCFQAGCSDFIAKPFDQTELLSRVAIRVMEISP